MANCLITSAGSNSGVNIIKALSGYRIIAVDYNKLSAGLYLANTYYVIPKATDDKYKNTIIDICNKEKIDIIFPSHSEEISVLNKIIELEKMLVLSNFQVYDLTENKILCKAFLRSLEILTPNQYSSIFPQILKPIVGTGSKNTYKVNTQEELDFYLKKDMFYEEFIDGIEYTIIGVSDLNAKAICALPTIRIEKRGGMAIKSKTEENKYLAEKTMWIANMMGLIGVWNMQCIKKEDKYYFIDINNRFPSGSMPLATASGMNIPRILIDILKGKKIMPNLVYGKISLRYYDTIIL